MKHTKLKWILLDQGLTQAAFLRKMLTMNKKPLTRYILVGLYNGKSTNPTIKTLERITEALTTEQFKVKASDILPVDQKITEEDFRMWKKESQK